jgi:hypothetical protein
MADKPFVNIKLPITWTSRAGLTGGSRKPRRYRPPSLWPLEPGPRPKPRPAYSKRCVSDKYTHLEANPIIATKRPASMPLDVETPAKKKRSTRKSAINHHTLPDEIEDSSQSSQVHMRRGTRA